jgi:murein DD-endopeptidase MepM/ murein hydrolase activator NlpD
MAKIDSSRLLPQSKSSAIVPYQKPSITLRNKRTFVSGEIKPIKLDRKSSAIVKQTSEENLNDIGGKLVKVEKFLGSDLTLYRKQQESKRKKEEKQDFQKAEEKLEAPKPKGFSFPKFPELPKSNFLDRIKRFIFFTALGRFLPAILEFLPKLEGIVKTIGTIYGFAENIFGRLLDGFTSLVKFGGDLKDKTLGFITQAGLKPGQNFETEFNKLEKQFNLFVDASIIAGILGADVGLAAIDEYKKWRGKNKPGGEPRRGGKPPVPRGKVPVTQGRGGQKPTGKPRVTGGKTPGWWNKITGGIQDKFGKYTGKLAKPFSKFAATAIPGLGAAVGYLDATQRAKSGDKLGSFLAGLSASLDAFTFAIGSAGLVAAATGVGLPGAAVLAATAGVSGTISMGIDIILLIRDLLRMAKVPDKLLGFANGGKIIRKYQGGGSTATRGGQPVKAPPRRTLKVQETKKPFKVPLIKTKPGKDVGGEGKIKILYPEPKKPMSVQEWMAKGDMAGTYAMYLDSFDRSKEEKKPNPFGALMEVSKELKPINVIGQIMGAGVDLALGQVPDRKIFTSFFDNIGYLADTWMNQRMNRSISLISREVGSFADGGFVSSSREMRGTDSNESFGEVLSKILGPMINQRINESIQHLKKEIQKKPDEEEGGPGGGGDGGVGGAGIESIDLSGLSPQDIDALGRMIQAESGGEGDLGKAAVMNVILNRYRLVRSGDTGYMPRGKNKDNVTIRDLLYAPSQFSPIADGSFSRTSSVSGRSALARAIALGGNDPRKFRENLIRIGKLREEDADYVVVSTAFSNPKSRSSRPFRTREVRIENHVFQESPNSRLRGPGQAFDASVTSTSLDMTELPPLPPTNTLPGKQHYGAPRDGRLHAGVDFDAPDNGTFYSRIGGEVIYSDNAGGGYGNVVDIYNKQLGVTERIAEGSRNLVRRGQIIPAGTPVQRGTHQTGVFHYEIRKGRATRSGSFEGTIDPIKFLNNLQRNFRRNSTTSGNQGQQGTRPQQGPQSITGFRDKRQLADAIGRLRVGGPPLVVPGVGIVKASSGDEKRVYYFIVNGKETKVGSPRFFAAFDRLVSPSIVTQGTQSPTSKPKGKQAGGLITPSKSTRPVPSSFASYENYGQGTLLAIQPIIIERTTPTYSSGTPSIIAFPVPVGVNNNMEDILSFNRG